jgi:phosphatidylglycerol:prolipoprotein diacylglycerol transferase
MCPRLFQIGPFTIYGYGLMLALGFIVGSYLLVSEFKRRKLDPNIANNITLIALVAGVAGSKILYLIENWTSFILDPIGMTFNPGGLTYYGGFLLAAFSIYFYGNKKGIKFFTIADAIAPGLILGYGIARIGCHLAGDGDYGFPTTLPWGTNYSNGTYPPSVAFQDFPEITSQFPRGIVPNNIPCHPTPIYEFIICALICWFLWNIRKKTTQTGKLFMIYLMLAGFERFAIEFLRPNPRIIFGLSEAQLISLVLIALGLFGWRWFITSVQTLKVR